MTSNSFSWEQERLVSDLDRNIWQLTHLVNAVTNELSACLSLNSLAREARTISHLDLSDVYVASLLHSRASLTSYVDATEELRRTMPEALNDHTTSPIRRQAYTSLVCAAYETRKIKAWIEDLERLPVGEQRTNDGGKIVHGVGWPQCVELGMLKGLAGDLTRWRDEGAGERGTGWKVCAKAWTEVLDP